MTHPGKQLSHWQGEFGDQYADRNAITMDNIRIRVRTLAPIWRLMRFEEPRSILECGCNVGLNLLGLHQITGADLFAIEPNAKARAKAVEAGAIKPAHLKEASLDAVPFGDASMDLVFTSGVLIHVAPERLDTALDEVYRVSRRWVLLIEYFSKEQEMVPYRGETDLLFKCDFGARMLDRHPDLVPVDEGFYWNRTTGFDDTNWWLFRKP